MPLGPHNDANPHNPECRDVSQYHITRAGATEQEVGLFIAGLIRLLQPRAVVETGTGDASTTEHVNAALLANASGRGFSIDIDARRSRNAQKLMPTPNAITFLTGDATTFAWGNALLGLPVDLAFIDGGTNRAAEFHNLAPWLAPGAFLVFHDMSNGTKPRAVVNDLALNGVITPPIFFPTPRGLALARLEVRA